MYSLSKEKTTPKKPKEPWSEGRWAATVFGSFFGFLMFIIITSSYLERQVSSEAKVVVSSIEQRPDQWQFAKKGNRLIFANNEAGIAVNGGVNEPDAVVMFFRADQGISPFERPTDRKAIYAALRKSVANQFTSDDIKSWVIEDLKKGIEH